VLSSELLSEQGVPIYVKMIGGGIITLLNTAWIFLLIYLIVILVRYDQRSYLYLAVLSLFGLSRQVNHFDPSGLPLLLVMLVLSPFVKKKLFPNIPLIGVVPKNN